MPALTMTSWTGLVALHESFRGCNWFLASITTYAAISTFFHFTNVQHGREETLTTNFNFERYSKKVPLPFSSTESAREYFNQENLKSAESYFQRHLQQRETIRHTIDCANAKWQNEWYCGHRYFQMAYFSPLYSCYNQFHIAEWGEGGKWVCDIPGAIPRNNAIVYSVGSKAQVGFETAILEEFKTNTFTFDPTLQNEKLEKMKALKFIHFNEIGLTGEEDLNASLAKLQKVAPTSPKAKMMRIDGIMALLNHSYVDVFKVDCERCEETFIPHMKSVSSRNRPLFGQILIEMHRVNVTNTAMKLFEILEELGYRQFHAEPNYYFMEKNWEFSYIHESLVLPKSVAKSAR